MGFARLVKWIKIPFFLLCLAPLGNLVWMGLHNDLTANPIEYIRNSTGFWTLTFLCLTLAITPLRKLLHRNELIRFRRMVGLFAFFYGSVHFLTYVGIEQSFDLKQMLDDVTQRPFITAGYIAFLLMIPLAVTSTSGMVRRLGGEAVAVAAPAGVSERHRRRGAFLLESKIRHHRADAFYRGDCDSAGLSPGGCRNEISQAACQAGNFPLTIPTH